MNTHTIAPTASQRTLARMSTDDLVALGEAVATALYARVLDEFSDDCVENVNGIKDDLAAMARRTGWAS